MSEPVSTGVGAAAGWNLIGGAAGAAAAGTGFAALVVMCMTKPRTDKEWVVGLVSTVMGSVGGGAAAIMHWNLQHWVYSWIGLIAMAGLMFSCGLPAWAIVRWLFNYIAKKQGADLAEVLKDVKEVV